MSASTRVRRDTLPAIMTVGMRAKLRLATACLLCLGLVACGSSGGGNSSDRQQIEQMFASIESAMAQSDWADACRWLSRHQQASIVSGANRAGLKASTCAGAFSALINTAGISKAQLAQAFGGEGLPKIRSLTVHDNQATVTYTAIDSGKTFTETDGLVREDGTWKADRTISRHNG